MMDDDDRADPCLRQRRPGQHAGVGEGPAAGRPVWPSTAADNITVPVARAVYCVRRTSY